MTDYRKIPEGENAVQIHFANALLNPQQPVPEKLRHPHKNKNAQARFDVYRNNVKYSLRQALAETFPRLVALIGAALFEKIADAYICHLPPSSPVLAEYGDKLPEFIMQFDELQDVPYASDIAQLDFYWLQAYYAADHQLVAETLMMAEDIHDRTLQLASCMHWFASNWPIFDIWQFLIDEARAPEENTSQSILVYREIDFSVQHTQLPSGGAEFLTHLQEGVTLGAAAEAVDVLTPEGVTQTMGLLIEKGLIIDIGVDTGIGA